MPIKRYKPEQIVNLLRGIEVEIANGKKTPQAVREAGINVQTYYRWRKEFGGLKLEQAKRLKELEKEREITEDDRRHASEKIEAATKDTIERLEKTLKVKEDEIMAV